MKLHEISTGQVVEIRSRADLAKPSVQDFLERNHKRRNIACGCGLEHGLTILVDPRHLSGGGFTPVRDDIDLHLPWCALHRDSDNDDLELLRSCAILGLPQPVSRCVGAISTTDTGGRRGYDSFSRFARRVFSRGMAEGFLRKNRRRLEFVNPSAPESLLGIDVAIRDLLFVGGANGYEAARQHGTRLRFGLIFDPVEDSGSPIEFLNVYWWDNGFGKALVPANTDALTRAMAGISIFKNVGAPPYFVLGVVDGLGRLVRLFLHQVFVAPGAFIPSESNTEVAKAADLYRSGAAILKPVRMDDAASALEILGFGLPADKSWVYRPDYFLIWRGNLYVRELRGFKPGKIPAYDALMPRKAAHFRSLFPGRDKAYDEMDGTGELPRVAIQRPESWPDVGLRFEEIPSALIT